MLELIFAAALLAAPEPADAELVKDRDKLVCRTMRTTSSRVAYRVCKTKAEWDERGAASRRKTEQWQNEPRRPNSSMDNGSSAAGGRLPRVRDRPPAPPDRPL